MCAAKSQPNFEENNKKSKTICLSFNFDFVLELTHEKDEIIFFLVGYIELLNILIKIQLHSIEFFVSSFLGRNCDSPRVARGKLTAEHTASNFI